MGQKSSKAGLFKNLPAARLTTKLNLWGDFGRHSQRKHRECAGTRVVNDSCMSDRFERLCISLVLLGVMILLSMFGHTWLPLSASSDGPTHKMSRPDLPDWRRFTTASGTGHESPGAGASLRLPLLPGGLSSSYRPRRSIRALPVQGVRGDLDGYEILGSGHGVGPGTAEGCEGRPQALNQVRIRRRSRSPLPIRGTHSAHCAAVEALEPVTAVQYLHGLPDRRFRHREARDR